MTAAIKVTDLCYEYPTKRALHDVSVTIEQGAVVALVGPNGAGKTTLLRCLAAIEMPYSGSVRIFENDSAEEPRQSHRAIGYLTDSFGLYEELTAKQCLQHAGAMQGLSGSALTAATDQALNDLGLTQYVSQKAGTLSRGLRQRLAIAQAMIHHPKVLLMDEPASGLDPEARAGLAELIRRLMRQGMTLVVSSHILAELDDYCSHMLTIEDGRVLGYTPIAFTELQASARLLSLNLVDPSTELRTALLESTGVSIVECTEQSASISFTGTRLEQASLLKNLIGRGLIVAAFAEESPTMQDIYLAQLKAKRDSENQR